MNDLETPIWPHTLGGIREFLTTRQLFLKGDEIQAKINSPDPLQRIEAMVNQELRDAFQLCRDHKNMTQTAKILERIQMEATETERMAIVGVSDWQIRQCTHLAREIATIARNYFHRLKKEKEKS